MAIKQRRLFRPTDDAGVARQTAMAQAMQQASMSGAPASWDRAPVVPEYGFGNALTQIAQAMGGAYLEREANAGAKDIDKAKREKLAKAMGIDSMTAGFDAPEDGVGPVRDPNKQAEAQARAKAMREFNELVPVGMQEEILATQAMQRAFPTPPKKYTGTRKQDEDLYVDGQLIAEGSRAPREAEALEQVVGPDGKPRLVPRSEAAGQTPYIEPKGDGPRDQWRDMTPDEVAAAGLPRGTSAQRNMTTGAIEVKSKRDNTGVLSQKDQTTARMKINTVALARRQLDAIRNSYLGAQDQTTGKRSGGIAGTASAGPMWTGQGFWPSEGGKKFDKAVDMMRSTLTALTRVPGVGSMTDYETRLDQAKFPSRSEHEAVTMQNIDALEDMLATIENGYQDLLSGGSMDGGAANGMEQPPIIPGPPQAPGTAGTGPQGNTAARQRAASYLERARNGQ
jgi:hypothetical protein